MNKVLYVWLPFGCLPLGEMFETTAVWYGYQPKMIKSGDTLGVGHSHMGPCYTAVSPDEYVRIFAGEGQSPAAQAL